MGIASIPVTSQPDNKHSRIIGTTLIKGLVPDGVTDNWRKIQRAIDKSERDGGGTLQIGSSDTTNQIYLIDQALRLRSKVRLIIANPKTIIKCDGQPTIDPSGAKLETLGQWPFYGCLLLGGYESRNYSSLKPDPISEIENASNGLALIDAAGANAYATGDVVSIESADRYTVGNGPSAYAVPTWRQIDVVSGVERAAGKIYVQHSIPEFHGRALLLRLSNSRRTSSWPNTLNALGQDSGVPLWATHGSEVIGGVWDAGPSRPFMAGGGATDCHIVVEEVRAGWGIPYGNSFARCTFHVKREVVSSGAASELAEGSHDNAVYVGDMWVNSNGWVLAQNESARNNTQSVHAIHILGNRTSNVIDIANATGASVRVDWIDGMAIQGSVIAIQPLGFRGFPIGASNNSISVASSHLPKQYNYVVISDESRRVYATNNRVMDSNFSGAITSIDGYAFLIGSASPKNVLRNLRGEMGNAGCHDAPQSKFENVTVNNIPKGAHLDCGNHANQQPLSILNK